MPPILLVTLSAMLAAGAPVPVESPAITVTNSRLTDAEVAAGAQNYVRAVLPVASYGQYARWADPVCVKVTGIDDIHAARVAARIDAVAGGAAIRRGKPGCRPNLLVVFTEDAATTVAVIVRKKPKQIAGLNGTDRARLLADPLPVRFWHGLELRGADGRPAAPNASAALMSAQSNGLPLVNVLPNNAPQTDSWSSSLIDSHIAVWATSAVVIVDVGLAAGTPLDAVGDYVAMVGLAPMKLPPPAPAVPSILGLFEPAAPAPGGSSAPTTSAGLSSWDKAFLASLYRMQMNRRGERQRGQLVTGIKADLAR